MQLSEALAMSPAKIKRVVHSEWIEKYNSIHIDLDDLLAYDWEIVEQAVPVTKSMLKELVNKHIAADFELNKKFENLCKELGLN